MRKLIFSLSIITCSLLFMGCTEEQVQPGETYTKSDHTEDPTDELKEDPPLY